MKTSILKEESLDLMRFYNIDTEYESKDILHLKNIFRKIFSLNDSILFLCSREQSLTPYEELVRLKVHINSYVELNGKYFFHEDIVSNVPACAMLLKFNSNTEEFIFDLWFYYNSLLFFPIKTDLHLDRKLCKNILLKSKSNYDYKQILNNYSNVFFVKGEDGDMLDVFTNSESVQKIFESFN